MTIPVLAVDDDAEMHELLDRVLQGERFSLAHARTSAEALALVTERAFSVALVDLHYYGKPEGFALLERLREQDPQLELVVLSSSSRFDDVRGAMRAGAGDYLPKGFGKGELVHALESALARRRWKRIERRVRGSQTSSRLVGDSPAMRELRETIARFGPSDAPVLLTGETGTGKELAAAAIHASGPDPTGPFVPVNCAALPASTIDSFFFGHERGAFTGAERAREGVFEEAEGGTLFLDEVNSLPAELQGRLLRVLQEKKVRRLGGSREKAVDFRLVTATNRALEELVKGGQFREDLFFRVGVLRVGLPPLRERLEDLEALASVLLPGRRFGDDLWQAFRGYSWPGNVRELRNVLRALDALALEGETLGLEHLPEHALKNLAAQVPVTEGSSDLQGFVDEQADREREFLARAYRSSKGNVSAMARMLSLDRSHLHQKLVKLQIHKARA